MEFAGKVTLITGGGSGIGRAAALQFAERGAAVVVADLDADHAKAVADEVLAAGGTGMPYAVDVTDPAAVEEMVAATVASYGGLDVAVNNAGTSGTFAPIADQPVDAWRSTVELNLSGVFYCMRAEIPRLLERGGGAIVNTSSGAGLMGFAGLPAYVASKHGVVGLTRGGALEYAKQGIRVNCVCPGTVRTPMLEGFTGNNEDVLQAMGRAMPVGRLATPEEIGAAIVWLASPAASYVTGHALAVDGGAAAQ
jgi:NAD(P)-dependent dehydrogenase (short-subunit alcohol dehydrogenase family)